jgi:hypothetical protein
LCHLIIIRELEKRDGDARAQRKLTEDEVDIEQEVFYPLFPHLLTNA